jgi:hypothetical protein
MKIKPTKIFGFSVVLLFSAFYSAYAQQTISGEILWKEPLKTENGISYLTFDQASYDLEYPAVPKRCETLPVAIAAKGAYDVRFTSVQYVTVSNAEASLLRGLKLESSPTLIKSVGQSQSGNILGVCFYPYVRQNGQVLKVTSYTLIIDELPGFAVQSTQGFRNKKTTTTSSSVLDAEGWFKIAIDKTGIHKITPDFLSKNGITSSPININKLRIVGNGVGMLPEKVGDPRPDDVQEVAVKVYDQNNDGIFNGSDYALFFARGPHTWNYNKTADAYSHNINTYREKNFYFLTVSSGNTVPVPNAPAVSAPATVQVNSFDDYQFVEDEKFNLVGTGRQWFGDVFDFTLQYSYSFNFPNVVPGKKARIRISAGARASSGNTFMTVNNGVTKIGQIDFPAYGTFDTSPYVEMQQMVDSFASGAGGYSILLEYVNAANPAGVAWLDFIEVQVVRRLTYAGGMLFFRDGSITGNGQVAEYTISNATSDLVVWDVTDQNNIVAMPTTLSNNNLSFKANADQLREYVAFRGNSFGEPEFVGQVAAQNLHALPAKEMIIVTHPNFMAAAERLRDFHESQDNISTVVVTTDQVYNEYSSGGQDIAAIRDFARHNYEKSMAAGTEFNYLLLMGDASYDYKDIISGNSNYVPVWESQSSLNLEVSAITDDFYGFLDSSEGSGSFSNQIMDISVGRIPCSTLGQAQGYVDKVLHYSSGSQRFGDWRNRVLLMADDMDDLGGWENTFVLSSEEFANKISAASESFNIDKIYLDAYDQVSTTGSETYPEATNDMFRKVQQGNLLTNYIGHGGEIGLASEKFLGLKDVNGWTNIDAMPVFMTITCEFTRLDDPKRLSAGEQLCLNPNGGAIALISTTRVVGASTAIALNRAIFNTIFIRPGNEPKTLGSVVKDAKNNQAAGSTRLKFSLFGDPAVKLALPYYNMVVNEVNGKPVSQGSLDTLQALTKVNIKGQVNDFSDSKISSFNGVADISVYDKISNQETKVNDGIGNPIPFKERKSLIYRGKVEVKNGDFQFEFLVPKDIAYQFGFGKFSMYATNNQTDAAGYFDTIVIGGFNNNAPIDDEGPTVRLFINDESFVRGGITDEDPELYAIIADSSGINTVGNGIGHNLVAILDNNTSDSYIINEYYESDLNSYQSGTVRYPFYDLEEGEHTLKIKVFDVYNNPAEAETEFIVAESADLALKRVLNYPNPFTTFTDFQFEHNRSDQPLEVQVQIFTVSGKLVKTINQLVVSEGNRVQSKVTWNGLDDYGDKIGKGVYVYRVKIRSQIDNQTADKYEKLVILR